MRNPLPGEYSVRRGLKPNGKRDDIKVIGCAVCGN